MRRVERKLCDVEDQIQPGDIVLCRGQGWASWLISVGSGSAYTHVGMLDRNAQGELLLLHMLARQGGVAVTLRSEVEKYPGLYDWFRANEGDRWWREWDAGAAVRSMWRFTNVRYGRNALWKAALRHLPVVRLFQKFNGEDAVAAASGSAPPYCSMAVSYACSAGGVDPVNVLGDELTLPSDLAKSLFFGYEGTLF